MSDVQFDEGNYSMGRFDAARTETPMLVKLLLNMRVVQNDVQANYVLIGIAVCAFAAAFFIFYKTITVHPQPRNQNVILKTTASGSLSR